MQKLPFHVVLAEPRPVCLCPDENTPQSFRTAQKGQRAKVKGRHMKGKVMLEDERRMSRGKELSEKERMTDGDEVRARGRVD